MPSVRFPFRAGEPERVEVAWTGFFKSATVSVDGQPLGNIEGKALRRGERYQLADGSTLEIRVVDMPVPELRVSHQGIPLPGSAADPEQRVRAAGTLIAALGALGLLVGMLAAAFDIDVLRDSGFGALSALFAVGFGALGIPARKGSVVALAVAVALYVIDGVAAVATVKEGVPPPVGAIIARLFFLVPMLRALPAALELRKGPPVRATAPPQHAPPPHAPPQLAPPQHVPPQHVPTSTPSPTAVPDAKTESDAKAHRRGIETALADRGSPAASAGWGRDRASAVLRFVAPKCEIVESGLHIVDLSGHVRDVPWADMSAVVARRLPPDPPWEGKPIVDVVVRTGSPVRLAQSTLVNFAPLPGGAAPSRLENLRRLVAHVQAKNPGVTIDPETRAFAAGPAPPKALATLAELSAYDRQYG